MRQETARRIKETLNKKPTVKQPPTVSVSRGKASSPIKILPEILKISPNILLSGGIGDFIAIESFISLEERNSIKHVFLATRAARPIQSILEAAPIFPRLEKITILHDDWSDLFCIVNYNHLQEESVKRNWKINFNNIPKDLVDYSIWHVFNQIKAGVRTYHPSPLLIHCLADISHFNLPSIYTFIQPYSPNDRQGGKRDFTQKEWDSTLNHLRKNNRKGIIILNSNDYIPDDPLLINLSNKTTITEALEIAKKSQEYIGVDSCFAALMPKILNDSLLTIKTVNSHYMENVEIYCAPKQKFDFICSDITGKL